MCLKCLSQLERDMLVLHLCSSAIDVNLAVKSWPIFGAGERKIHHIKVKKDCTLAAHYRVYLCQLHQLMGRFKGFISATYEVLARISSQVS